MERINKYKILLCLMGFKINSLFLNCWNLDKLLLLNTTKNNRSEWRHFLDKEVSWWNWNTENKYAVEIVSFFYTWCLLQICHSGNIFLSSQQFQVCLRIPGIKTSIIYYDGTDNSLERYKVYRKQRKIYW